MWILLFAGCGGSGGYKSAEVLEARAVGVFSPM